MSFADENPLAVVPVCRFERYLILHPEPFRRILLC